MTAGKLDHSIEFTVPAPPDRVFPLLCPVLEYRWIPTWRCDLLHSDSGVAEEDCVFRTDFPGAGPMTWVVNCYQPPKRIEFCCSCRTISSCGSSSRSSLKAKARA